MSKYERIKEYYRAGLWSRKRVRDAVLCGYLTEEEAARILGAPQGEDKK